MPRRDVCKNRTLAKLRLDRRFADPSCYSFAKQPANRSWEAAGIACSTFLDFYQLGGGLAKCLFRRMDKLKLIWWWLWQWRNIRGAQWIFFVNCVRAVQGYFRMKTCCVSVTKLAKNTIKGILYFWGVEGLTDFLFF